MALKAGTTGTIRTIQSLWDYFIFYEIRLAKNPSLYIVGFVVWLGSILLTAIYAPRSWSGGEWIWVFVLLAPIAAFFVKLNGASAQSKPHFVADQKLRQRVMSAHPTMYESTYGFKRLSKSSGFDGPIAVSDKFNHEKMANPDFDWEIQDASYGSNYSNIIDHLKSMRLEFLGYGRQSLLTAIMSGKALINETKVAFAEPFPTNKKTVSLFKTSYFAGLCSSERTLDCVVIRENGTERVTSFAGSRLAFKEHKDTLLLPDIANNSPPISLHFGIEVLAVSNDNIFRISVQSNKTQYSREMRAPLASGSIDWDDLVNAKTLKQVIRNAARRELIEEWGRKKDIAELLKNARIEPIGYFRNVIRNGKPQFVAIAKLPCSDGQLEPDTSEVFRIHEDNHSVHGLSRSLFYVPSLKDLSRALDNILDIKNERTDSVALLGATYCLKKAIVTRPQLIEEILGFKTSKTP